MNEDVVAMERSKCMLFGESSIIKGGHTVYLYNYVTL